MAARADGGRTLARSYGHFDALLVGTEVGLLVDKASETMAAVQNRDQFHGAEAIGGKQLCINRHTRLAFPPLDSHAAVRRDVINDLDEDSFRMARHPTRALNNAAVICRATARLIVL